MENPNLVNAAYVIEMLRKHGLLSGMELGYFHAGWCDEAADLLENALATIRELTESLDRVQKQCGEIIVECDERDAERLEQVAKLMAENKRLTTTCECDSCACTLLDERDNAKAEVAKIKADTVQEMQERLKETPIKVGLPLFGLQTKAEVEDYANELILQMRDAIDKTAKELLEGV